MEIAKGINQVVVETAARVLQPFVPELNGKVLMDALKAYGSVPEEKPVAEKAISRKEAAKLLGVSLNSVNRYVKQGRLSAKKISRRLVRIDPQSIRSMLNFNHEEA